MSGSQQLTSVTQIEQQRLGYNGISLTNFDNTTVPQIAAGSKVEVAGALYYFTSSDSLEDWAAVEVGEMAYIKLVISGTDVTGYFASAAAVWSASKQGWYASAGSTQRYIGGCYKASAAGYADKFLYQGYMVRYESDGISLKGYTDADRNIEFASDADLLWDESEDNFSFNKNVKIIGLQLKQATDADRNIEFASDADLLWDESEDEFNFNKAIYTSIGRRPSGTLSHTLTAGSVIYSNLIGAFSATSKTIMITGGMFATGQAGTTIVGWGEKTATSEITIYGHAQNAGVPSNFVISSNSVRSFGASLAW